MDPTLLTNLLMRASWNDILEQDLDRATNDFMNTILDAASKSIPKKRINVRDTYKSLVTSELRRYIRKRERLFRLAKRTDCPHDWHR